MSATNFNTKNDTYRKLLGNGLVYTVPRFQRDYSWGEEEWDDLWQDILGTIKIGGEPAHYMGYLVLQTSDDKSFDVIDGQQRLTTISLIVLAALRHIKRLVNNGTHTDSNSKRLESMRQTYVGYLDPVTLVPKSKLTLNRNNDHYYQNYLVALLDQLPQRGFKASEHSLRKAFEWFDKKIGEYSKDDDDSGRSIAQLIDSMSDKLFFTVITVNDELNAYKVFETLNARGVRLSATDLLKNYLFSVLHREGQHENELKNLDDRWEKIIGRLGAESFPDFLRIYWISRGNFVRQVELFKAIRGQILNRQNVFELIQGMEQDMDTYLALTSPDGSNWSQEAKKNASILRMFSVRQPYPLLMAAYRQLSRVDFEGLVRVIMIISFRYNVIGNFQTSEQERTYFAELSRIHKGEHTILAQVISGLNSIYPSDDVFRNSFSEKSFSISQSRNNKILRYILCKLEKQISNAEYDYLNDALSIEHICPTNPESGWDQFTDEEVENLTQRIGNMTLLSQADNRKLGNSSFNDKKEIYGTSVYMITKNIVEDCDVWVPSNISSRQNQLANIATAIWRIGQI